MAQAVYELRKTLAEFVPSLGNDVYNSIAASVSSSASAVGVTGDRHVDGFDFPGARHWFRQSRIDAATAAAAVRYNSAAEQTMYAQHNADRLAALGAELDRRRGRARGCSRSHHHDGRSTARDLPMPPHPPPLPPCLQCIEAGACCSLTTTTTMPYARAFADDRRGPPTNTTGDTLYNLWQAAYDALVKSMLSWQQLNRQQKDYKGHEVHDRLDAAAWATHLATLAVRRDALVQRLLRRAVSRGAVDAPFWLPPPTQCARCTRTGDMCLQQTTDLTTTTMTMGVAWFASSGPPPLSLLPQHGRSLPAQIRDAAFGGPPATTRHQQRAPILEAIFCRDPTALSAPAVAARAQALLWQIAAQQQHRQHHYHQIASPARSNSNRPSFSSSISSSSPFPPPPPAPAFVVARRLPRHSMHNVYAGRGVATAALSYSGIVTTAPDADMLTVAAWRASARRRPANPALVALPYSPLTPLSTRASTPAPMQTKAGYRPPRSSSEASCSNSSHCSNKRNACPMGSYVSPRQSSFAPPRSQEKAGMLSRSEEQTLARLTEWLTMEDVPEHGKVSPTSATTPQTADTTNATYARI